MVTLFRNAIANFAAAFKRPQLERAFAVVLAACLMVIAVSYYPAAASASKDDASLGEKVRERLEETDRNTERPKTTGEFQDEIRQGVPLGERVKNTIRDSKEAFQQFGQEYSVGAEESARSVGENAADAAKDLVK